MSWSGFGVLPQFPLCERDLDCHMLSAQSRSTSICYCIGCRELCSAKCQGFINRERGGWDAHNELELPSERGCVREAASPPLPLFPRVGTAPGLEVCLIPAPFWDFTSQLLTAVVKHHSAAWVRPGPWCGDCVPWALGWGRMDLGRAQFPFQDNGVSPKK